MRKKGDAFGQLIHDCFNDIGDPIEIVERDDGYIDASRIGPEMYLSEYDDWPELNRRSIENAKGKILDIGAGGGRFSLYLQKRGFEVTALDTSKLALDVCRARGIKNTLNLSVYEISKVNETYDTVLMMGNNLALLGSPETGKKFLSDLSEITSTNSVIIGETIDVYKTEKKAHLEYHELNRKRGRMSGQTRLRILYKKLETEWFDYMFLSPKELEKFLEDTPWKVKELYFDKGPVYNVVMVKR